MENIKFIGNYLRLNSSNLITRIKLFIGTSCSVARYMEGSHHEI